VKDVVGKDVPHDSAAGHVSGESIFLDDVAPLAGELLAAIVPSPVAHGRLRKLDVAPALALPGIAAVLTYRDIPGRNQFGAVIKDEFLLVEDEASFLGQPLVIIAGENSAALHLAQRAVVCEMEELKPIFSIDEAFAANSYLGLPRRIARGDLQGGFAAADHCIEGSLEIGGQEHFYLESMVCVAMPGEGNTMTVHSSTQHPTEVQEMVAEVLGIPFNQVVVICKRMGGGFGGKETQAAQPAMMAALLAARTRRPVRFAYNKDDDMRYTGKRHPFKIVYRAGFTRRGLITALDLKLYSNGGCSTDLSLAVLERGMLHSDNAYFLPNVSIEGRVCRTNLPSNTAFRGFGGPQGVTGIENIIEEIALSIGIDAMDVRQANCYGIEDRNITPYGQTVQNNTLPELFTSLRRECDYDSRREALRKINNESSIHLRGLSLMPVKFGISFTRRSMNQANALVNIYLDGSVLLSTGATEMGQGVNTRVRQIVAEELGIGYDRVNVTAASTDKNNNTSPTAASSGTDLNGAAAVDACSRLRERLAQVAGDKLAVEPQFIRFQRGLVFDHRAPEKGISFPDLVRLAYELRVNLGERGFYATPGVDFDRDAGRGTPFFYFTNGVACSEVLIDRLTGETKVTRVDLLMDLGQSINPGIDRGQIVGGFVQGMGWVTTEELVYSAKGNLLSCSPTTYKIPAITDVPETFNIRYLDNPNNIVSLYRSKAVGEPPLLLGISVWLAIKNALSYAGVTGPANLSVPATGERVLFALAGSSQPKAVLVET
jgi:xanthine dehydrogenase large subunit